jgi:hypothetical protein
MGDLGYEHTFQMQGTLTTDLSQFTSGVQETPFLVSGTVDTTPPAFDGTAFFMGSETDTLTVVYNYTPFSSVPEPRYTAFIATAVLGGIVLVSKLRGTPSAIPHPDAAALPAKLMTERNIPIPPPPTSSICLTKGLNGCQ